MDVQLSGRTTFQSRQTDQQSVTGLRRKEPWSRRGNPLGSQCPTIAEPMFALAVHDLPEGCDRFYDIKLDGYRCIPGRDSARTMTFISLSPRFLS